MRVSNAGSKIWTASSTCTGVAEEGLSQATESIICTFNRLSRCSLDNVTHGMDSFSSYDFGTLAHGYGP